MTAPHPEAALSAQRIDHEFKSHPDVFWPAARGEKPFEFRKDDRGGFYVGQTVRLRCYDQDFGYYSDAPLDRRITNILRGGEFGLQEGYCILGLAPLSTAHTATAGDGGERVRHVKRRTEYEVLGEAEAQVSEGMQRYLAEGAARIIYDGHLLTVYRCETTGKLWCRFTDEFRDGRFETISTSPTPTDAQPKAARPVGDEAVAAMIWNALFWSSGRSWDQTPERDMGKQKARALARDICASHPTAGQETVATPRDGGVREAREQGTIADEPYDPLKCAIWAALLPFQDELRRSGGVTFMGLRNAVVEAVRSFAIASQVEALSAPGSAGPGEARRDAFREAADKLGDLRFESLPEAASKTSRLYREFLALATPSPAQEPGTGDAEEETEALARKIAAKKIGSADPTGFHLPDDIWRQALPEARRRLGLPTPATTAETRAPADQTKGGL